MFSNAKLLILSSLTCVLRTQVSKTHIKNMLRLSYQSTKDMQMQHNTLNYKLKKSMTEKAANKNHCQKLKSYIKECSMSVISEVR